MHTTLFDNNDFAYFADISSVNAPAGGYCFTITSRWRSAKDSESERVQFKACIDGAGLLNLSEAIKTALVQSTLVTEGGC